MKQIILSLFGLLLVYTINAQTEKSNNLPRGSFGIGYNYIFSTQKTNSSPGNSLFADNGHSITISVSRIRGNASPRAGNQPLRVGVIGNVGLDFGNTSNKDLEAFAKSLTTPLGYKITQSSKHWQSFVIMAGPSLNFFRRRHNQALINVNGTVGYAAKINPRRIMIDKIDNTVPVGRVYDQTDKKGLFAWQLDIAAPIAKLSKRVNLCLDAGYGYNGARVGVLLSITGKVVVERIIKTK